MALHHTTHRAFTLIEVVFAIVILGIVASLSSRMIVQVYQSYIMQKTVHNASIKTELAINQLANRLTYRIDRSMLARKTGQTGTVVGTDIYPAAEVPISDVNNYPILEWIGYDSDSLEAPETPAWSGYCDLNRSSFANLVTPGSDLSQLSTFTHYGNSHAVVFVGNADYRTTPTPASGHYQAQCMYRQNGCIFPVNTAAQSDTLRFNGGDRVAGDMLYTEFYRLAASAFAVVPDDAPHQVGNVDTWDLHLHYDYHPWDGENYLDGKQSMLLRNVSVFRFRKEANSIRIKLCVVEPTAIGDQISICKEKAVIR